MDAGLLDMLHDAADEDVAAVGVKEKISEMIIHATVVRACLEAALSHAQTGEFGAVFPDELYTNAGKYTSLRRPFQRHGGSPAPVVSPAGCVARRSR